MERKADQSPVPDPEPADVLAHLARRYSVSPKHLVEPAPDREQLLRAAALALRAPDHEALRPYRFVRIDGAQRARLAALFARGARGRGCDDSEVERARARAYNGPALLALIGRVRDGAQGVPACEQWLCAGAALMNFLNALHLMGFGAKVLGGTSVYDAEVQQGLCAPGESLLCWIVAGTPACAAHSRYSDDPADVFSDWQPSDLHDPGYSG
jgi:nitroreductase